MSDSGSGSDWISILAIIVAGGISIIKGLSKKKKGEERPVYNEPESEYSYQEEEEKIVRDAEEALAHSTEVLKSSNSIPAPGLSGDFYRDPKLQTDGHFSIDISEEPEEEQSIDFDVREAVLASEILRRPQY